jgi:hypothetical protein
MSEFKATRGRPPKYPWPSWTGGGTFTVDVRTYDLKPRKFVSYLRDKAKSVGMKVTASIDGDSVTFRFYAPAKKRKAKS